MRLMIRLLASSRHFQWACILLASLAAPEALAQTVRLSTTLGDIVLELDAEHAPGTTRNFAQYVREGQYDGTIFHRVISGFMIQGGGMTPDLREKSTGAPIALENKSGLTNRRGTIAMARTMDPNSARAQFFINVADNPALDPANSRDGNGYAVFGKVVQGMDVVDKIKAVATGPAGMHNDVPLRPIIIKKATLEK